MQLWKWFKKTINVVKSIGGFINYQENDPSTPELKIIKTIPALPSPCPPFGVLNFTGNDAPDGTIQHQAANVYCTVAFSLAFVQSKLEKPIINWAAMTKLLANPRSGKMFNAYYDRYYLNFFYDTDPTTHETIYTCDSTDVVAHELGHAILDSLRPDLWSVQCVEIQAFHEAFGDINAMLTAMTFPEMIKEALDQTSNNLRLSNTISKLAEQMGQAIGHTRGISNVSALRNAVNDFKYVHPETLPSVAPNDGLAGEPHNFSRVFVGAWYDSFVNIYNNEKLTTTPEQAVINARDKIAKITYNGVRYAQISPRFFESVLKAMLIYDNQHNFGCTQAIRDGFTKHDIVVEEKLNLTMAEQDHPPIQVEINLSNSHAMLENEPLNRCIVHLANHQFSNLVNNGKNELEESLHAAYHSVKVIHENNRISNGPTNGAIHDKEFSLIDGRIVRNFYCCHFHK